MEPHSQQIYRYVFLFTAILFLLGIALTPGKQAVPGLWQIFTASNLLVTDYFVIAGIGPTFINVSLVTLITAFLMYKNRLPMKGGGILTIGLMSGFSFFGKNIFNMWFILLGTLLYCRIKKEAFARYLPISLLSTALSPLISATFFGGPQGGVTLKTAVVSTACGLLIGFVMPMLAGHTEKLLHGLSLYNGGFALGLLGLILVPLLKSYGFTFTPVSTWGSGYNLKLGVPLYLICLAFLLFGYCKDPVHAFSNYKTLLLRPGNPKDDFLDLDGAGAVLINMGVNGIIATSYVLLSGGQLNGPTLGGIFAVVGFGAKGKHAKNIIPIMLGVYLGGLTKMWSPASPAAQLAALFGTTLAPVSGAYGPFWGIVAGFSHSSVVLHAGLGYSGVNLYNNGFAGGIVSIVMYAVLSSFFTPNTFCTPSQNMKQKKESRKLRGA